tara:strand:- start:10096 stop:10272 length:177 start_codon:yes stop_codon:yes gene_type:complete
MNLALAGLTIATLALCGPGKNTIIENQNIEKPTNSKKIETIIFKKVPTKWVKITKKSN